MTSGLPPLLANKYRPLRELGRGGMGAVYLVEHANTGERFALKVLLGDHQANAQVVERFKMEARASARIGSENVVRMIDADTAPELGGALYLVMELLDGADLDKLVDKRGPLPAPYVASALTQTARALDKAHAAGIVHRDLKPENLFLHRREDGSSLVKILDFGISKFLSTAEPGAKSIGLTKAGAMLGTPLYMAPEQVGTGTIRPQTDVWAMGLIAFQLLTGKSYWRAAHRPDATVMGLIAEITVEPFEAASVRAQAVGAPVALPSSFDAWFARCVQRDATARFASAGEAAQELRLALGAGGEALDLGALLASSAVPQAGDPALDATVAPASVPAPVPAQSTNETVAASVAAHAISAPPVAPSFAGGSAATQIAPHALGASTAAGMSFGQSAHVTASREPVGAAGSSAIVRGAAIVAAIAGVLTVGLLLGRRGSEPVVAATHQPPAPPPTPPSPTGTASATPPAPATSGSSAATITPATGATGATTSAEVRPKTAAPKPPKKGGENSSGPNPYEGR